MDNFVLQVQKLVHLDTLLDAYLWNRANYGEGDTHPLQVFSVKRQSSTEEAGRANREHNMLYVDKFLYTLQA
jgi:hypothetical protein